MSVNKKRNKSPFYDARSSGIDVEMYHAMGMLITSWKTVETFCWLGVSYLLKTDPSQAQIVMGGMQARSMLTTLRSLVHFSDPARKAEFDKLYDRLERALKYRNEIAHAPITGVAPIIPLEIENNKVRLQKRGVVLRTRSKITAHMIFRRALFTKIAAGTLIEFIEPYKAGMVAHLSPTTATDLSVVGEA